MIYADRDILLLNKKLDRESRRDVFFATQISGVSVYEARSSSMSGGLHADSRIFKIRIPVSATVHGGKTFLPETQFDALDQEAAQRHWTIRSEDLIIVCAQADAPDSLPAGGLTTQEAEDLAKEIGYQRDLVHVIEYADNTLRGSDRVKHWRIQGAQV